MISDSSPEVANIDGHWRLAWSLISGSVRISRGTCKLTRISSHESKK